VVLRWFHYEEERFVLFVVIVIKIPKLLLGFPPLDHATEAGDCEEDLYVPVPAMPIWVVIPRFTDHLHSLDKGLDTLGLRCELGDSHINDLGRNRNEFIEIGHDGIDGVVNKDAGRTAVVRGSRVGKRLGQIGMVIRGKRGARARGRAGTMTRMGGTDRNMDRTR